MDDTTGRLTEGELEIMQVIWELRSCTVRQVYETLRERRQVAYTTVMTMMKILEEKGHLTRERQDRAYLYRPAQPKSRVISKLVNDFLTRVFEGSAKPLVLNLVREKKLSDEDLEEIARIIREREKK
ncbi:MAG: BlaI/MecI/CopY family transcriptional regulator [Acidobacteriota bacterium]|jgi:BlaI family penicillinase repressor